MDKKIAWGEKIGKEFQLIVYEGWKKKYPKILNMVFKYSPKVEKIKNIIRKTKISTKRDPLPSLKEDQIKRVVDIVRLLVIEGRYFEREGKFTQAINNYLLILKFSVTILEEKNLTSFLIGNYGRKSVAFFIENIVNDYRLDRTSLKQLYTILKSYDRYWYPFQESLKVEKKRVDKIFFKVIKDKHFEKYFKIKSLQKKLLHWIKVEYLELSKTFFKQFDNITIKNIKKIDEIEVKLNWLKSDLTIFVTYIAVLWDLYYYNFLYRIFKIEKIPKTFIRYMVWSSFLTLIPPKILSYIREDIKNRERYRKLLLNISNRIK